MLRMWPGYGEQEWPDFGERRSLALAPFGGSMPRLGLTLKLTGPALGGGPGEMRGMNWTEYWRGANECGIRGRTPDLAI